MIQMQTILKSADNSGARRVMCIKVLGGSHRRFASVGDVIKVAIKDALPKAKVKRCISRCRYGRALIFSKKFGWLLPSPLLLLVLLFLICSTTFLSKSRELHTYLVLFLFFYSNYTFQFSDDDRHSRENRSQFP